MIVYRKASDIVRAEGAKLGFVPTMGALHEGHLSLMRMARAECDVVAASVFVNPRQFGPGEDLEAYPRNEEKDFKLAESAGVDWMFAPSVSEVYDDGATSVTVAGISDVWEGACRPGHFTGVATVVCILFHIVDPDTAYFGLKDYQQCLVIERMVRDLRLGVELRFGETVREPDGLAMSSRNAYLDAEERRLAPELYRQLWRAAERLRSRQPSSSSVSRILADARQALSERGFIVDYFELVDSATLAPLSAPTKDCRLIAAAKIGGTRLIDNLKVG